MAKRRRSKQVTVPKAAAAQPVAKPRHRPVTRSSLARMAYDAATTGWRSGGWRPTSQDANNEIRVAGARIREVAREMDRNNPYAHRGIRSIVTNLVGQGIIPNAKTKNKRTKAAIEKKLREHFDTTKIDATGRTNLYGLQDLAVEAMVRDGEVLIIKRPRLARDKLPLPFQIEVLEADYLDPWVDGELKDGNYAINGVEFDANNRRVAYHIFKIHPGGAWSFSRLQNPSVRIPAEYVIHLFRPNRPGQVRGVSWLAPCVMRTRDLNDYLDAQLMRQKIAACFAAFITDDGDETDLAGDEETTTANDIPIEGLEPGLIQRLRTGQSVTFGSPPPVADFEPYVRGTLREIAAGLGVSYEALTGDLTGVNFSSGRMGWLEFQRNIDTWRSMVVVPQMLNTLGEWFMAAMRASEGMGAEIEWTAPRREMISPKDEVGPAIEAIKAGLDSRDNWIRRSGRDPEAVDLEIKEGNERAKALGLKFTSDAATELEAKQKLNEQKQAPGEEDDSNPSEEDADQTEDEEA